MINAHDTTYIIKKVALLEIKLIEILEKTKKKNRSWLVAPSLVGPLFLNFLLLLAAVLFYLIFNS